MDKAFLQAGSQVARRGKNVVQSAGRNDQVTALKTDNPWVGRRFSGSSAQEDV